MQVEMDVLGSVLGFLLKKSSLKMWREEWI